MFMRMNLILQLYCAFIQSLLSSFCLVDIPQIIFAQKKKQEIKMQLRTE